jgi:hypothetical protein
MRENIRCEIRTSPPPSRPWGRSRVEHPRGSSVRTDYIARVRQLLNTIRQLQPPLSSSAEVDQELAALERELQDAAKELTIQACRNEIQNRRSAAVDRRQSHVPVALDLRVKPRRSTDDVGGESTIGDESTIGPAEA